MLQGVAKPGLGPGDQVAMVNIVLVPGLGKESQTTVLPGQLLQGNQLLTAIAFAGHDAGATVVFDSQQDHTVTVPHQQHHRQGHCGYAIERPAQQTALQSGPGCSTGQQLGWQTMSGQGQAAGQGGTAGRTLVQRAQ